MDEHESEAPIEALLHVPPLDSKLDFADRLNSLIESPAGPSDNAELATEMRTYPGHAKVVADRISRLRRGERPNPGIAIIPVLCQIYGVPPAYWFSELVEAAVLQAVNPSPRL